MFTIIIIFRIIRIIRFYFLCIGIFILSNIALHVNLQVELYDIDAIIFQFTEMIFQ